MESPFYGNHWSQPARPRYSSNLRGIPVQPIHQNTTGIKPAAKVVQIPVQFVGSDTDRSGSQLKIQKPKLDRFASALRIQKVFRGFLVRKYVKRIISIRKEVDEIERKLLCSETAELIRRDERERLRVNETLMSLLLKLDSIRGVDSGVRDFRKAVIRKAISLQEKVDSIVTRDIQIPAEEKNQNNNSDNIQISTENQNEGKKSTHPDEVSDDSPDCNYEKTQIEGGDDMAPVEEKAEEMTDLDEVSAASPNCTMNDEKTQLESGDDVARAVEKAEEMTDLDEVSGASPDCTMNGEKTQLDDVAPVVEKSGDMGEVKEESQDCPMHECVIEDGVDKENEAAGLLQRVDESKRNRELLEKMVEENGKMMRMMNELCKRNEVQTRMLNSLTQRVEQLEKAFVCDRLKNKKKKRNPAA